MRAASLLVLITVLAGCAAPVPPAGSAEARQSTQPVQHRHPPRRAGPPLSAPAISGPAATARLDEIERQVRQLRDSGPALGD